MKLDKLWIGEFKNLLDVTVDFDENNLMTVIVGWNGAGKSNVIEALVIIFRDLDLGKPPSFAYELHYRIGNRSVRITAKPAEGKSVNEQYSIFVNWKTGGIFEPSDMISINEFRRMKGGYHLPQHVFAYYSGPSQRLEGHFREHQELFYRALLDSQEEMDQPLRPLFYARPIHSQFVLLAFFLGHDNEPRKFIENHLGIVGLDSVLFVMHKPKWAEGSKRIASDGDPRFWGARGTVKTFLGRLHDVAIAPLRVTRRIPSEFKRQGTRQELFYLFAMDVDALKALSEGLTPSTFFKMLESTYISDVLHEVRIRVKVRQVDGTLTFRELSEGEQQLLVVLGLLRFTGEADSLFLLDEPDTHLNPTWAVKYLSLLRDFVPNQDSSHIIMATHNPFAIAELEKGQVQIMWRNSENMAVRAVQPDMDPRGLGFSGILTSDMFGLVTTLDSTTVHDLERLHELADQPHLSPEERKVLHDLRIRLENLDFSTRDPLFREYLRARKDFITTKPDDVSAASPEDVKKRREAALAVIKKVMQRTVK